MCTELVPMSMAARRMEGHSTMGAGLPDMPTTSTASPRRRRSPAGLTAAASRTPLAQSLGPGVGALAGPLGAALEGDEPPTHQARAATRRLREIVPIVVDVRAGRGARLRRRLKRLTSALGPVRE